MLLLLLLAGRVLAEVVIGVAEGEAARAALPALSACSCACSLAMRWALVSPGAGELTVGTKAVAGVEREMGDIAVDASFVGSSIEDDLTATVAPEVEGGVENRKDGVLAGSELTAGTGVENVCADS